MGFLFGMAFSIGAGVLVLSRSTKIGLSLASLFSFVAGSFLGAIGFGWVYTQIATRRFGDSWPGLCEMALLTGMGMAAILVGYFTAKMAQTLVYSGPRKTPSRDLEGPVKDDLDWY